jgi:hypothetical protein
MRHLILTVAIVLLPIAASAQPAGDPAPDTVAAAQTSQGPMVVERIHNGFLVAPDFKFTEIDHRSSGLAGGYAGVVFDEHFFVGGGAYALATDRRGREMAYGGLMLQWLGVGNDLFGFSAKALLGGGRAESSGTVQTLDRGRLVTLPFRSRQSFLVAEPGVDALLRITSHVRLAVGAGYRFTGSPRRWDGFDGPGNTRLDGAVGSIALQIGGGS